MPPAKTDRNAEVFAQWWSMVPGPEIARRFEISRNHVAVLVTKEIRNRKLPRQTLMIQLRRMLQGTEAPTCKADLRELLMARLIKQFELEDDNNV